MRRSFAETLRCPRCGQPLELGVGATAGEEVLEGSLRSACGLVFPVISGVPRILPPALAPTLLRDHAAFFDRYPDLSPLRGREDASTATRTLRAFGDEWRRFPDLLASHDRIFRWYFEGPEEVAWEGLRVLDAGCGMGRWLHFARRSGAAVVGMDVSPAIDVAAERERSGADFVQADLCWAPFAPAAFDLVYCLGVVHHLAEPIMGVRALASLVRPAGELRLYVYRSLDGDPWPRRLLLEAVTLLRRVTTRLPFPVVHAISWAIAALGSVLFILPRRWLRGSALGDRLTRGLPLVQYADVPFRMLVAEQFDRLCAPIEGRYGREEVAAWLETAGLEVRDILAGLGWRAIGRRRRA
ncbi:MAG TPA: methyltransferase domain-containing protein [Vicinamibacteria bacterium]|nr:methyltransferase domain-containing protein [Vicinamibacteria bacterium]